MSVLSVRNLETFYGAIMALRGVSIDVEEGEIVTILGANGAGKTTLMKTIAGLMDPEKGVISFHGENTAHLEPDRIVAKGLESRLWVAHWCSVHSRDLSIRDVALLEWGDRSDQAAIRHTD